MEATEISPFARPTAGERRARRWLEHATSAACVAAVALLLALAISMAAGYRVLIDRSDSMRPAIAAGDLIVTKRLRPDQVDKGDIVTFSDDSRDGQLVTHRVIRMQREGDHIAFVTRGDANTGVERWSIDAQETLGKFAFRIPKAGYFASWFTIPALRVVFVALVGLMVGVVVLRRVRST